MSTLENKIDFVAIIEVTNANPNGDPLNGNMPRITYDGFGEISDVSIKRKIRNRLLDMGEKIFVQSDDKKVDGFASLKDRAEGNAAFKAQLDKKKKDNIEEAAKVACAEWMDVRTFGQVFAFKGLPISLGIRGPVTVQSAFSVEPIDITSLQITKSVNSVPQTKGKDNEETDTKSSDTMGMKHRVDFGVYVLKGSINVQLAEKTGFTTEDADRVQEALRTLFVNDVSSARPDGSMQVAKLYWWKHNCKIGQYSSKKVHESVSVKKREGVAVAKSLGDYEIVYTPLAGLEVMEFEGL